MKNKNNKKKNTKNPENGFFNVFGANPVFKSIPTVKIRRADKKKEP